MNLLWAHDRVETGRNQNLAITILFLVYYVGCTTEIIRFPIGLRLKRQSRTDKEHERYNLCSIIYFSGIAGYHHLQTHFVRAKIPI